MQCITKTDTCVKKIKCLNVINEKKVDIDNSRTECGKKMSKYIYWVKKKTCLGVLDIEEIREKDNETGLKERGGIKIETVNYSAFPYTRLHALFRYLYLKYLVRWELSK